MAGARSGRDSDGKRFYEEDSHDGARFCGSAGRGRYAVPSSCRAALPHGLRTRARRCAKRVPCTLRRGQISLVLARVSVIDGCDRDRSGLAPDSPGSVLSERLSGILSLRAAEGAPEPLHRVSRCRKRSSCVHILNSVKGWSPRTPPPTRCLQHSPTQSAGCRASAPLCDPGRAVPLQDGARETPSLFELGSIRDTRAPRIRP